MRLTIVDVAREAGVSTATVDRVINNREGVRERTRDIVLRTAQRLGYIAPDGLSAPAVGATRLDFVLPAGTNTFMLLLEEHLRDIGGRQPDLDISIHAIDGFRPESLAVALRALIGRTQGVGVVAIDHPMVREAIRELAENGIKVATLVSDLTHVPIVGYVGIDNRAAGRLAGYIMGRFLPRGTRHKVGLFAGSLSYRGHEEREMGFRHIVTTEFDNMDIVRLVEVEDDRVRAYKAALNMLREHPEIGAIYNIGAGTEGIGQALKELGRDQDIVFIGHELTGNHRPLLVDGTIDALIDQYPRVEAREVINLLKNAVRGDDLTMYPPRLQVVFRENIPAL